MPTFVPDVPYHIQAVFIFTFGIIWYVPFLDDYLKPMPTDPKEHTAVSRENVWKGVYSAILFMCAFAYLKPYQEYGMNDFN